MIVRCGRRVKALLAGAGPGEPGVPVPAGTWSSCVQARCAGCDSATHAGHDGAPPARPKAQGARPKGRSSAPEARGERVIAERAGINKERLYKYYGDKRGLFETVLTAELDKLAAAAGPADYADVGEFAGRTFDYYT